MEPIGGSSASILKALYAAFNQRNIDGALILMSDTVDWPKASEGGRVTGREAIRTYWSRQWTEFDPRVIPTRIVEMPDGTIDVTVHQVVATLKGEVISDSEVHHRFSILNGLVERMDIEDGTAAFAR